MQKYLLLIVMFIMAVDLLAADKPAQLQCHTYYKPGNPTCEDISVGEYSKKVEASEEISPGTHTVDLVCGTLTYTISADKKTVESWSSTVAVIKAMIVKGGDGANIREYGSGLKKSDGQVTTPPNNGGQIPTISHVSWCYDCPTVPNDKPLQFKSVCHDGETGRGEAINPNSGSYQVNWTVGAQSGSFEAKPGTTEFTVTYPGQVTFTYTLNEKTETAVIEQQSAEECCTEGGKLSVAVFVDANGDGKWNKGEDTRGGVEIIIDGPEGSDNSGITGGNGWVTFTFWPGHYIISAPTLHYSKEFNFDCRDYWIYIPIKPAGKGCPPVWHQSIVVPEEKIKDQYQPLFTGLDFSPEGIATRLVLSSMCQVDNLTGRVYNLPTIASERRFADMSQRLAANPNFITRVSYAVDFYIADSLGMLSTVLDSAKSLMTHPRYYVEGGKKQVIVVGNNVQQRLTPEKLMLLPQAQDLASFTEFNWPVPNNMSLTKLNTTPGYHSVFPSYEETEMGTNQQYLRDYYARDWFGVKAAGMFCDSTMSKKASSYREAWGLALTMPHDGRWFMQGHQPSKNSTVIETDQITKWALTFTSNDSAEMIKGDCANRYEKVHFYELLKLWQYRRLHPEMPFDIFIGYLHRILNKETDLGLQLSCDKLVFTGLSTTAYPKEGWDNAVDGDLEGWDGTVTTRGPSGFESAPAWGIFQFACSEIQSFNRIDVVYDNGIDQVQQHNRQARKLEILVSQTDTAPESFTSIYTFVNKKSAPAQKLEWITPVHQARYIKLVIHEPNRTNGAWRQIVEFKVSLIDHSDHLSKPANGENTVMPAAYELQQNYPNPFNPQTTITFTAPQAGEITLSVFNSAGQRVKELVAGYQPAGSQSVIWDGRDDTGNQVSSGIYHLIMNAGDTRLVRKMMFIK